MKTLLFLIPVILFGCKSKDGCSNVYADCNGNALGKDLAIYCFVETPVFSKNVQIINASCKTLNTKDYTLGDENDPDACKLPGMRLKPGEHKIFQQSDLPFQIDDFNETIYLKYKGKIISVMHLM